MKNFLGAVALTAIIGLSFSACSNNDDPSGPDYTVQTYSQHDKALYQEILKAAYGPYLDGLLYSLNATLDDPESYPGARWSNVEDCPDMRITEISLNNLFEKTGHMPSVGWPSESYGHISPAIWDLESLNSIYIESEMFHGEIPPCGEGGKNLRVLNIDNTNITSLPLDLFMLPNMTALAGWGNMALKQLPDGMNSVPYKNVLWRLREGGLTGSAPADIDIDLILSYNEYTSVDWDVWKDIDVISRLRLKPNTTNTYFVSAPLLTRNRITGSIPEEILTDTLRLIYIYDRIHPQLPGYGLDNMPPTAEVFKMKNEYMANHPDIADMVYFLRPGYEQDYDWEWEY